MTTKVSVVNEHSTSFMGGIWDIRPSKKPILLLIYKRLRVVGVVVVVVRLCTINRSGRYRFRCL